MKDAFGREIDYLRLSITDLCNLRCRYCMPEAGVEKRAHEDILRVEELVEVARAASAIGVRKVRVTGGEPLVRRGALAICEGIASLPGVSELCLTTNGALLPEMARDLKSAGVARVNVSLDTLREDRYRWMTRGGDLARVLEGISAALGAGLAPLKVNAVLVRGFNDDEILGFAALAARLDIDVRFIELMPIGEAEAMWGGGFVAAGGALAALRGLIAAPGGPGADGALGAGGRPGASAAVGGPGAGGGPGAPVPSRPGAAAVFPLEGGRGRIGVIDPVSHAFCGACNRIRVTADGMVKPCLHSRREISVRGLSGERLEAALREAVMAKPAAHGGLSQGSPSMSRRGMERIGG